MTSWKLSALLLVALVLVLTQVVEAGRRRHEGRRRPDGRPRWNRRGIQAQGQDVSGGNNQQESGISYPSDGDDGDDNADNRSPINGQRRPRPRGTGGIRGRGRRPGRRPGRRGNGGRGRVQGRRPALGNSNRLVNEYARSNSNFGINIHRQMAAEMDNFAFSPVSIHAALSMVLLGAGGLTKREMIRALDIRSPVHPAFQAYSQSLETGLGDGVTLSLANALYTRPDFEPKARYVTKLRRFYNSQLATFDDENPEDVINQWVAEKTNDMIPDFLSDGAVNDDMVMMLINAVYFNATWQRTFDPSLTSLETFTDLQGNDHQVYMMQREGEYNVHHSDALEANVLRLPYQGDRFSMYIILPDQESDLGILEARLNHDLLNDTLVNTKMGYSLNYEVKFPKFSLDTDKSMTGMLQSLGINNVFASNANLRKMTSQRVQVNEVRHRCVIEVDERGSRAAAVTGIGIEAVMATPRFTVDRPFMFVLRDDQASINLFLGRYSNPEGDNIMS